ncbi:hypothetical protein HYI36_00765 [Bacillus sp. Gen3]|uniref:hypothetical protein n=1 Tax=Heyndrickxia oleronia TaxID=38875 RepID=UPI0015D46966|nr:hypothetical protein [Bacillus sp. Gen3]
MPKYEVHETTKIITTYIVEAQSAPSAIRQARKNEYESSSRQSVDQYFEAMETKEEEVNE